MRHWIEFFRQFRSQYTTTGAVAPSSRFLARALCRPLAAVAPPRRILEVGPGTGAVTAEIVRGLRPGDWLDIVEINAAFLDVLERRFRDEAAFRHVKDACRLIHAPVQQVTGSYDFLVSGVPLNNFELPLVDEIFASYRRLLAPGGTLSYFEYLGIRSLREPFTRGAEHARLKAIGSYLDGAIRRYQVGAERVFLNLPPAVARHLRFTST